MSRLLNTAAASKSLEGTIRCLSCARQCNRFASGGPVDVLACHRARLALGGDAEAQTTKAYVATTGADSVVVIDTAGESVLGTVAAGTGPTRVAVSRDGTRAYVLNRDSDSISVIDTATDTNVGTIAVGDNPASLAVTPDGRQIYVVLAGGRGAGDRHQPQYRHCRNCDRRRRGRRSRLRRMAAMPLWPPAASR